MITTDLFPENTRLAFEPSRAAGLARMQAFAGAMGSKYSGQRNYDLGPDDRSNVSCLSPWVRTRTLLEEELVLQALDRFSFSTVEKFVQEVCWRTYFKGWLEHRPEVWTAYCAERDRQFDLLESNSGIRTAYDEAVTGKTGIDCFDAWATELVETGYLHNHARMWFASIWMFTLKLPWELGADFFLQYLMDADAASNTLSWRWVGGLHTQGKTYLARTSNIRKYTEERFSPTGLSNVAEPLLGFENPAMGMLPRGDSWPEGDIGLLLTEDYLHVETLRPPGATIKALAGVSFVEARSPKGAGSQATRFIDAVLDDALKRGSALWNVQPTKLSTNDFLQSTTHWAEQSGLTTIMTGLPPQGWVKPHIDALKSELASRGIVLTYLQRDWDRLFWPHAKRGFFGLKKKIPDVLAELGLPV